MIQSRHFLPCIFFLLSITLFGIEGNIEFFEGSISVQRLGASIDPEIGMTVNEQDSITTGTGAHVIISLPFDRVIKLGENTVLELISLEKETKVSLKKGSLFSRVSRLLGIGFSVRTPSMTAGVRGTEFFVSYGRTIEETPDIWLCVNDGSVEVSVDDPVGGTQEKVIVNEGEGIQILAGKRLTEPRKYSWTEDLNWNIDPEKGETANTADIDSAYSDLLDIDYD